jgi:hypothetical protein
MFEKRTKLANEYAATIKEKSRIVVGNFRLVNKAIKPPDQV